MNGFLTAATALLCGLVPLGWLIWKSSPIDGLVAFELASVMAVSILLLLCQGVQQSSFADLALALALLSFGGGLVFARFLERWV
ncbi:MAG TPA: monovalent cation/H+ antiporter complex subunit F [Chloroflexota bacterium]|nr:monovalent cation/H+ antiporter complex subunit F [Chloroflexota bacterium]